MLYSPPDPTLVLWDTWLFQHDDTIHLFHLQRKRHEIGCSSIGHAITQDWFHWETLPLVLEQGTGDAWDAGPLMTGMTLKHAGRYYMFYGAMVDRVQRIGLAVSDDLVRWEKLGNAPVLEPAGPWYETDPRQAVNYETAWRDPYVFYHAPEDCFYAFFCARVPGKSDVGGGCIGVARSSNLLEWALLPPAYVSDALTCLEVPEYFSLGGKHYLTYTTSYHFGTPYPRYDPFQKTGTFFLASDAMLSGYDEPEYPHTLHASLPNTVTNYVGRSIPANTNREERLYYYHNVLPPPPDESLAGSLAMPKLLQSTPDHHLVLKFTPHIVDAHLEPVDVPNNSLGPETSLILVEYPVPAGVFTAVIRTPYAGIGFRIGPMREGTLEGLAVWLAPAYQHSPNWYVLLGAVHFSDGPFGQRPALGSPVALCDLNRIHHDWQNIELKIVHRGLVVDVYVDQVLYLSHMYDPAAMPESTQVGFFYAGQPKTSPAASFVVSRFKNG